MFEIGSSLREARRQRGLELDAVQRELRIRRRYLEALEHDRFDQLPGEVYARGFLREYADFLGLDGSLYVEEYNARFAPREELPIAAPRTVGRVERSRRGRALGVAALAALAAAVAGVAFLGRGGGHGTAPPVRASTHSALPAARPHARPSRVAVPAKPRTERLILTAARGDCWLGIRVGSASGPTLYWRTLPQGSTVSFPVRNPLWVRIGAGQNLDATLGGKPLAGLPALTGTILVRA